MTPTTHIGNSTMDTTLNRRAESGRDRALSRIVAEIHAGLQHGFFEYRLTCEVIGQGRRRLVLHAGRNFQFVVAAGECEVTGESSDPPDRGAEEDD